MLVNVSCYLLCYLTYFLEKIMQDTLKEHGSTISIGGISINNLHFADDIDLIVGLSNKLQKYTDSLAKSASRYRIEISHEKIKILFNYPDPNKDNSNNLTINIYGKNYK